MNEKFILNVFDKFEKSSAVLLHIKEGEAELTLKKEAAYQNAQAAVPFALHNALLTKGDSDFYLYGWGVPTHDSAYVFDYLVHTRGKNRLGTWNITGYSNPQLDAQIESLSSEGNRDKRNATIQSIWEATRQAGFYIPLHDQMISNASIPSLDVPIHPNNITYFKLVKVKKP